MSSWLFQVVWVWEGGMGGGSTASGLCGWKGIGDENFNLILKLINPLQQQFIVFRIFEPRHPYFCFFDSIISHNQLICWF